MNEAKPTAGSECAADGISPLEDLSALQRELRGLVHDQLQLAAVELRLAAHSLTNMISAAFAISLLLVMAWALLMTAAVLGLISAGLQPAIALLLIAILTAVLAVLLARNIRYWSRNLGFPASLRALLPMDKEATGRSTE
ncbi:MAG: phage holin family protein [Xanthomonadales bacterium]|nr:phage holin family protein [Xanthomonadales bacterium]